MKINLKISKYLILVMGFLLSSCDLPGLIPLTSLPDMETNTDTLVEVLTAKIGSCYKPWLLSNTPRTILQNPAHLTSLQLSRTKTLSTSVMAGALLTKKR